MNFAMTKKLEATAQAIAPITSPPPPPSIQLSPEKMSEATRLSISSNSINHMSITADVDGQSINSNPLRSSLTNHRKRRLNNSATSTQIARLVTSFLSDCRNTMASFKDLTDISNLEVASTIVSERFSAFVGNVSLMVYSFCKLENLTAYCLHRQLMKIVSIVYRAYFIMLYR